MYLKAKNYNSLKDIHFTQQDETIIKTQWGSKLVQGCKPPNKMIAGTYSLRNTFDLPINHSILNHINDSVPPTADDYDRKLCIAIIIFAFSAFARIGKLVCTPSQTTEVIELSDVSFTKQDGIVAKATVCFRKFKHSSAGPPKYINFSHGNCKIYALTKS